VSSTTSARCGHCRRPQPLGSTPARGAPGSRGLYCACHGEPDGEAQVKAVLVAQVGQPGLGGAGAVGADQDRGAVAVRVGDHRHRPAVTVMWSAAVLAPALPGRSIAGSDSPVLSHHAVSVWWPNPPGGGSACARFCASSCTAALRSRRLYRRGHYAGRQEGAHAGSSASGCAGFEHQTALLYGNFIGCRLGTAPRRVATVVAT